MKRFVAVGRTWRLRHIQSLVESCHGIHTASEKESITHSQPEPALAYCCDDIMEDSLNESAKSFHFRDVSDVTGDVSSRRSLGTQAATFQSSKRSILHGGGGGGGTGGGSGRALCPKCGTRVTFQHPEFEENSFYCASCSGWFMLNANTAIGRENPTQSSGILMQHVSYIHFGLK
jgi:hypothetical protein